MKTKKTLISLLFLLLLTISISNVKATAQYILTLNSSGIICNPQRTGLQLTNGKYLYIYGAKATSNNIVMLVINPDATVYATQVGTLMSGLTIQHIAISGIHQKNSTAVFIFGASDTGTACKAFAGIYNPITNTWVLLGEITLSVTGSMTAYASNYFIHNNYIYYIITYGSTTPRTYVLKISLTGTNTLTNDFTLTSQTFETDSYVVQDPTYSHLAYLIGGTVGDSDRPTYYKLDVNAKTLTNIAVCTTDGVFMHTHQAFRFIGGGLEIDSTDDSQILYFTWVSGDNYGGFDVCQQHLIFNSTGRTTYLEHNLLRNGYLGSSSTAMLKALTGYLEGIDTFYFIHTVYHTTYFDWRLEKFVVEDWYSHTSTSSPTYMGGTTQPQYQWTTSDYYYQHPAETYMVGLTNPTGAANYEIIFCGIAPLQKTWTITTSHIPTGDLYIGTQYKFKATIYLNGYAYQGADVVVKFDNSTVATIKSNSDGEIQYTLLTNVLGYHSLQYYIYLSNVYQQRIDESLIFLTPKDISETQTVTNTLLYGVLGMLPILMVVFLPALICLYIIKHTVGFLIGLVLGGIMGTATNIIPVGAMFLIALLIIVYFVIEVKKT